MSETLRIACPCGYENWVPAEKLGQTLPCFVCGEDLLIEEQASPGSRPISPSSIQSTTSTSSAPSINKSRSPFEADDLEAAVRPKFQHAPPAPTPAAPPAARPRSPFEADAPEEDAVPRRGNGDKLVADPFTRELVPAPKPTPSTSDEMEKHRPTERRSRHVFIDSISPHDAPTGEKCMQCGRALRGSWDRYETPTGVLCYVCSNQATQDIPDRVKAGSARRTELRESDLVVDPVYQPAATRSERPTESSPDIKRIVTVLAVGTLLLTLYVFLFDKSDAGQQIAITGDDVQSMPAFATRILNVWNFASVPIALLLGMYFAFSMTDSLPHESLRLNILYLAALSVPLSVITVCLDFAAGIVPIWGSILCPLAKWALIFFLLTGWMHIRLAGLAAVFLFYKLLKSVFLPALASLVFRALGLV